MFLVKSISTMQTNLPNSLLSPLVDQTSSIVGRALDFNTDNDVHRMQPCVYPQIKDTCIVEHCLDADVAMEDAPLGFSVAESKDATEIECVLRNASISGYKDALLSLHSSYDNEDEGAQEHHGHGRMSNNLSCDGIGFSEASHESDSNPAKYSR